MIALNFIKKFHKIYLNKYKIDNNIYDNKNHNYNYYFNKYCLKELILKNKNKNFNENYLVVSKINNIDIIDLPSYFNKYNIILLLDNDIIINNEFNNINSIGCNNLIINNIMNNLYTIGYFNSVIINNKTNLNHIIIDKSALLIFNYPIFDYIGISYVDNPHKRGNNDIIMTIINNTNKNINIYGISININENYLLKRISALNSLILKPYTKNIITKNILISKLLK